MTTQEGGKRKPTAYNRFVKKFMAEHKKDGVKVTVLMKKAGAEWSKLTDAQKAKY